MEVRERLEREKLPRLNRLAGQLGLKGYSRLNKAPLIDFIMENCSGEKIIAALDTKEPLFKRLKGHSNHIYGIITTVGVVLTILFFIWQELTS